MLVDNRDYDMSAYNVTFAPGTRNNWHSHSVGQVLFCTEGTGYYQERGKAARRLTPGSVVEIPANTEHWHGAAPDSEFVHLGITPRAASNRTAWGGPVTDAELCRRRREANKSAGIFRRFLLFLRRGGQPGRFFSLTGNEGKNRASGNSNGIPGCLLLRI